MQGEQPITVSESFPLEIRREEETNQQLLEMAQVFNLNSPKAEK